MVFHGVAPSRRLVHLDPQSLLTQVVVSGNLCGVRDDRSRRGSFKCGSGDRGYCCGSSCLRWLWSCGSSCRSSFICVLGQSQPDVDGSEVTVKALDGDGRVGVHFDHGGFAAICGRATCAWRQLQYSVSWYRLVFYAKQKQCVPKISLSWFCNCIEWIIALDWCFVSEGPGTTSS